jgi:hypothetical protein
MLLNKEYNPARITVKNSKFLFLIPFLGNFSRNKGRLVSRKAMKVEGWR